MSQAGETGRLVNWIKRADRKITLKWINWKFMRGTFAAAGGNTTSASVATLAKPSDLKTWDLKTFKITYPGETDKQPLEAVEYEQVKDEILDTTEGAPWRVIIMPDNSLMFEGVPDGVYTIDADYYKTYTPLTVNGSIPAMPADYHDTVIIGQGMVYYGNYENAPEIKQQGMELLEDGLMELENHQLPNQDYSRARTGGGFEVIGGQDHDW